MINWTATKIIATLGPATSSEKMIINLIEAGANIFRLNFSHGDFNSHEQSIKIIRRTSTKTGIPVGILLDLPGPKIRVGEIPNNRIELKKGQKIVLNCHPTAKISNDIMVNYSNLSRDVKSGNSIYLDDGAIRLKVTSVKDTRISCNVEIGGVLSSHKGVNLPGIKVSIKSLTDYDRKCVRFGVKHKVDFIAMSFVRSADDIKTLNKLVGSLGGDQFIIAKIEKQEAINDLDNILKLTDGIMVARGDLGVEIPIEQVPGVQKNLIARCNTAGLPVITATQVLDSMVKNPRPTRAEASDAANAVIDGTDALMLSQETAIGNYPVEAVRMLKAIAFETEKRTEPDFGEDIPDLYPDVAECVARSVCETAMELNVKIIATPTRSGHTARLISRFKPPAMIVAFSQIHSTRMQLLLSRGVNPLPINQKLPFDKLLAEIKKILVAKDLVKAGESIVITAGSPHSRAGMTNLMVVETA